MMWKWHFENGCGLSQLFTHSLTQSGMEEVTGKQAKLMG